MDTDEFAFFPSFMCCGTATRLTCWRTERISGRVQAFLGHACVETTMIYLHVMEDQKDLTLSPLDSL